MEMRPPKWTQNTELTNVYRGKREVNITYITRPHPLRQNLTLPQQSLGKHPSVDTAQRLITPAFRRLVAITHQNLTSRAYTHVADLAEDVKRTAARQRIPYDGRAISAALAYVGYRRPLTTRGE